MKQRVFQFSPTMRSYGQIILGLMGFLYLLLFSVPVFHFFSLLTAEKDDFVFIAVFSLGLVPFTLIGLYLFYRHSGCVILTKEAVILKRFGKEKRMLYRDIVEVDFTSWHIPEGIILRTDSDVLSFSTHIEDYPELLQALEQKISFRKLEPDPVSLPFRLSFAPRVLILKGLQFGALIAVFSLIVIVLGRDDTGKINWVATSLLTLLVLGMLVVAFIGELLPKEFVRLDFTEQDITARYIGGKAKSWPVKSLKRITFDEQKRWFTIDGVDGFTPFRSVKLDFEGHPPLIIGEKRAKDFGYKSERLYANLNYLYARQLSKKD